VPVVEWTWELQAESRFADEYAVPETPPLSGLRGLERMDAPPVPAMSEAGSQGFPAITAGLFACCHRTANVGG
jgi:hypothetical protein